MINKTFVLGMILTAALWAYGPSGFAAEINKGPKEMVLLAVKDATSVPKPAQFPHAVHQAIYKCATCHHTKKDGKQVPYFEGMTIQKCEVCHYKGSGMPSESDEDRGIVKLDTFRDAAHARCRTCHNKEKAKKPELKEKWKGCLPCHVKKQ
jgi:Class III cytochrome C family